MNAVYKNIVYDKFINLLVAKTVFIKNKMKNSILTCPSAFFPMKFFKFFKFFKSF